MVKWKVEDVDVSIERQIITGLIVSDKFIKYIFPILKEEYFQSKYCQIICRWCIEHYSDYKKAPGKHIQDIFISYKKTSNDSEQNDLIKSFLLNLSKNYENSIESEVNRFNYKYIFDQATKYFRERALSLAIEDIEYYIEQGRIDQAESRILTYKKVAKETSSGSDPFRDTDLIIRSFEEVEEEQLFTLRGDLGKMVGPFYRDTFFAIAGPAKRGKTWMLMEIAVQALLNGLKVAYFSLGDMTEAQMTRRFHQNISGLPLKPGKYLIPVWDCKSNQTGYCDKSERINKINLISDNKIVSYGEHDPKYKPCSICKGKKDYKIAFWKEERIADKLTWRKAVKKGRQLNLMIKSGRLRQKFWPRLTASMSDINATLEMWENIDGFIPDVVITDYADIMKPEGKHSEHRHAINEIWGEHDALCKEKHCLVITGSHTNKATFTRKTGQGDLSEDSRKLNHVSGVIALNQTQQEKSDMVMSMVMLLVREGDYDLAGGCLCLQQLNFGQPCLDSFIL